MSNPSEDPPAGGPRTLDGRPADSNLPEGWGQPARRTGRVGDSSGGRAGGRSGGIATLFNTGAAANPPPPHDDDSDDEDTGRRAEEFFAGGERSGLAVTNPDQPGPAPSDMVKRILAQAKENGPTEPKKAKSSTFSGSGNRLGSEDDPEPQPDAGPSVPAVATTTPGGFDALLAGMFGRGAGGPPAPPEEEEVQVRRLTFWRNGFSIEDGPLLPYDTPENKELLDAVHAGRAPPSVFNVRWNQPLQVEVANRRNTDYQPPPKKPMQAFSGGGNRLGSPTPEIVSGAATPVVPGGMPSASTSTAAAALPSFEVDSAKPTTSIQVRLGDGTRLVAKVNLTHTIGDLRNFVAAARPDARTFVLQTTFPSKELSDDTQTVEDAKLQNAVVVQRFT